MAIDQPTGMLMRVKPRFNCHSSTGPPHGNPSCLVYLGRTSGTLGRAIGIKLTMVFQIVYSKSNRVFVMYRWLAISHLCIVIGAVWPPGSPASRVDPCQAAHLRWQYYCKQRHWPIILLFFRLWKAQRLVSILFIVIWQRANWVSLWPLIGQWVG